MLDLISKYYYNKNIGHLVLKVFKHTQRRYYENSTRQIRTIRNYWC